MKETAKKNLPLAIGLIIPLLMIAAVVAAIYLPRAYAPKPAYSFVYIANDNVPYGLNYDYNVSNGRLVQNQVNIPNGYPITNPIGPQLYIYDAGTGKPSPVTLEQAQNLILDPSTTSPDGYQVVTGSGGGFPFFFGNASSNARYLKGHGTSFPIDLQYSNNSYYNFRFLGWIIKN